LGTRLSPLVKPRKIKLSQLYSRIVAFDANNLLYQFLSLVRMPNGELLKDREGRVTSHLLGASLRISRLMAEYSIKPIMVFDGTPSELKLRTLEARRKEREKALIEWKKNIEQGRVAKAFSKAVVSATLTKDLANDAREMFRLMGIPVINAPEDAEAQASYMCMKEDVWAIASQDYDSLLYGAPRIVRYITISGKDFLPSKLRMKPLVPEIIELKSTLERLGISREQLIDVAILSGTDFNEGIPKIGPIKAYRLIKKYERIEKIPTRVLNKNIENLERVREIFMKPKVVTDYTITFSKPNFEELRSFLHSRSFSEEKIELIIDRLSLFYNSLEKLSLSKWL
jgi:flap endonuclease-1